MATQVPTNDEVNDSIEVLSDCNESNDGNGGSEILLHDSIFKPIYTLGVWLAPDDDENSQISVAILLFSGTDKKNEIDISVVDGGEYLEYSIKWPSMMTTAEEMHRKWLSGNGDEKLLQSYHPMVTCFKQFIAKLRNRQNIVGTTARIPLPFEVESRFTYYLLKSPISSARVLYVHLRAPAKQQLNVTKEEDIEFE